MCPAMVLWENRAVDRKYFLLNFTFAVPSLQFLLIFIFIFMNHHSKTFLYRVIEYDNFAHFFFEELIWVYEAETLKNDNLLAVM